ncbi:protein-lysine N-methyltransferase [Citrus sinensis]|uniref:Protein-lysine N-methyltransferase n=1 Tax=Citrus sinensis TaxID=2711 RepID=A0ACB8M7C3_CITSI|nr:protein-lysine N-methyltransferase [Citrus sinensis]
MATAAEVETEEETEMMKMVKLGSYDGKVRLLIVSGDSESESAAEETMLLWGIQQPTLSKPNAFVAQSSLNLRIDACGHSLSILQSPSSLGTPGVTGSVMWDSGVVLGKFLEHAVDSGMLLLHGKKIVELGSGCGLVGCIAALLGAQVILTDLPDRLRLLKKNIQNNLRHGDLRGSAVVTELTWGDDPDQDLIQPLPDYGFLFPLRALTSAFTLLYCPAFRLKQNLGDSVLEYFLEAAMKDFVIGRVEQTQWHPDYCSPRAVVYILVKKLEK